METAQQTKPLTAKAVQNWLRTQLDIRTNHDRKREGYRLRKSPGLNQVILTVDFDRELAASRTAEDITRAAHTAGWSVECKKNTVLFYLIEPAENWAWAAKRP